jgi:hypothetical protein
MRLIIKKIDCDKNKTIVTRRDRNFWKSETRGGEDNRKENKCNFAT